MAYSYAITFYPPFILRNGKFVLPHASFTYQSAPPYAIYLLSAVIEEAGYPIDIHDWCDHPVDMDATIDRLAQYDVLFFSCNSWNWTASSHAIQALRKRRKDQILVLGGIQALLFGSEIVRDFSVDYVLAGEAEDAIVWLIEMLNGNGKAASVPGLIYRDRNGNVRKNPPAPPRTPEQMAALPAAGFGPLAREVYHWLPIESSRGCVNRCTYCSVPYRQNWRPMHASDFVDKLEAYRPFLDRTISGNFMFIDNSFIVNVTRALAIIDELEARDLDIKGVVNAHVRELLNRKLVERFAPFTDAFLVGAESFDDQTLKRVGKHFKGSDIAAAAAALSRLGCAEKGIFSFVIGFPWQTKEMLYREIDQIHDLVTTYDCSAIVNWLIFSPGSVLWSEYINDAKTALRDFGSVYTWREDDCAMTRDEVGECAAYIDYLARTVPRFKLQHACQYVETK